MLLADLPSGHVGPASGPAQAMLAFENFRPGSDPAGLRPGCTGLKRCELKLIKVVLDIDAIATDN